MGYSAWGCKESDRTDFTFSSLRASMIVHRKDCYQRLFRSCGQEESGEASIKMICPLYEICPHCPDIIEPKVGISHAGWTWFTTSKNEGISYPILEFWVPLEDWNIIILMPKLSFFVHWSALNFRDRVLGKVEEESFIVLPGKGAPMGYCPQNHTSPFGEDSDKFYSSCSKRSWSAHGHSSDGLVVRWVGVQLVWGLHACGHPTTVNH